MNKWIELQSVVVPLMSGWLGWRLLYRKVIWAQ